MGLTVLSLSPGEKKQNGSRWWQNTFSLSTSSFSSASCKSQSDDNVLDNLSIVHSSSYLNKHHRSASSSRNSRLLTRVKKFRHLTDKEVDNNCRGTSNVISSPLPLPLPDSDVLPHVKGSSQWSNTGNVPLPSPAELHHKRCVSVEEKVRQKLEAEVHHKRSISGEEIERQKLESLNDAFRRCTTKDVNRRVHNTESLSSRRSFRQRNGNRRIPDHYQIYIPRSAPSSPVLSPQLSPGDLVPNQFMSPPSIFHVWSAPEMHSSAYTPDPAFCYQIRHDIALHKGDHSPIHGPGLSPERSRKCYNETASSLGNKLHTDTQVVRRDNNVQTSHPLPLPPGNPLHLPHSPVLNPPAKLDLHPNKDQWQKGKLIGRGTFGSVYVASNKETGALCAMKEVEILPDDPKSAECIKQLQQEIEVLSNLKHPNIVQYYGSERVGDRFYIFLEFVHPGSINKFIRDHCGGITESVVRNFTRHILCGLAYLHSKKTIHRDIKGANLLVDAYGVVKLADFGMAKHLQGHAAELSLKGSPYWMAPELLQANMHKDDSADNALAIDIWSLGCTIIEMLNGKPPWSDCEGPAAMFRALKETPPIPENLSAEGKDFLNCCFRRNPAERPTASMLLEHCFIKNAHPPDVVSSSHSLDGMKLTDKIKTQGESLPNKIDQVAASLHTEFIKGRVADNFKHGPFSPVRLF